MEEDMLGGFCAQKPLFPMLPLDFWGMMVTIGLLWVANMGGIGGGGLMVPACMSFFKFDVKGAIAISNLSVFVSSGIRYLINWNKPHPIKGADGIMVEYNLSCLMLPAIISGVSIGVLINILVPELAIRISYVLTLLYLCIGVFRKALAIRKAENLARQ
jgi:uncharacterized membrane protein YfcA